MPYVLLASGLLALLTTVNAIRPRRGVLLLVGSFFAAWLTIELAPWVLGLEVLVTALLAGWGGLAGLAGWSGVAPTGARRGGAAGPGSPPRWRAGRGWPSSWSGPAVRR